MNDDKLIIKSSSNNNNNKRKIWANENHFGSSVSISSPILLIHKLGENIFFNLTKSNID